MRIQAPSAWAGRTLAACEVGGDPFRVSFDSQAQADVTKSQFDHLKKYSGLDIDKVKVETEEETLDPHPADAHTDDAETPTEKPRRGGRRKAL